MKKSLTSLVLNFTAILLCVLWFSWKLAVVILLFNFAQNVENSLKKK